MVSGPPGTVAVGFVDGTVGLWSVEDGTQLLLANLHGPIQHLLLEQQKLYATSELGAHWIWDLQAFYLDRCALLNDIWRDVPVVWDQGRAVKRPPPADHPCTQAK